MFISVLMSLTQLMLCVQHEAWGANEERSGSLNTDMHLWTRSDHPVEQRGDFACSELCMPISSLSHSVFFEHFHGRTACHNLDDHFCVLGPLRFFLNIHQCNDHISDIFVLNFFFFVCDYFLEYFPTSLRASNSLQSDTY